MAFFYSADKREDIFTGNNLPIVIGSVALVGNTATVVVPGFKFVKVAFPSSQTANAARISAYSGNSFTITGTGTDRVDYIAVGQF